MFSDKSFDGVSIPSYWKTLKTLEEAETQTVETVGVDQHGQTTLSNEVEIQTDEIPAVVMSTDYDEGALAEFLTRICPKVLKEIDSGNRTKAFLSYQMPDEDSLSEVKSICTLMKPKINQKNEVLDLKVNSLAWSCTGSVVVLALGFPDHDDWCSHAGFLHFYNINRTASSALVPTKVLEATSCVTCVTTHPYEPSIVASGLQRGDVVVWNLQEEGSECLITVNAHDGPVTYLAWIQQGSFRPNIVSAGQDGQLIVWNLSQLNRTCIVQENFAFNDMDSDLEAGISCFSFSHRRPDLFVVALEGGKIVHCSMNSAKLTTRIRNEVPLKNPIIGDLEGHKGVISCLSFSPYHDEILLSVGTDRRIKIHSISKMAVLKEIWSDTEITGISWCLSQANVFISWGIDSEINVYDSKNGQKLSNLKTDISSIHKAQFNCKSPKLLAVSDSNGNSCVLQVPQYFQTGQM